MKIEKNVSLAPHTTMRIGGNADYFSEIYTKADLQEAISFAKEKDCRLFFLGGGSNILFSDKGFRGLVLKMKNKEKEMRGENIWAESGVLISELVRFAKTHRKDLSGFLALPGTWGAAVAGNAGIPDWEACDTLVSAEIFDLEKNIFQIVKNEWFEYEYRNSKLHKTPQKKWLVWSAEQTAPAGDPQVIQKKCTAVMQMRREKQPWGLSAGSFFKNLPVSKDFPKPQNAAGWLLDQVGAKGEAVGDAVVSEMHANFFQNKGKATQAQMLQLAKKMTERVQETFHVRIEPEVKIYDETGKIIPLWS